MTLHGKIQSQDVSRVWLSSESMSKKLPSWDNWTVSIRPGSARDAGSEVGITRR